ncbi:unnamed protein product [Cuscuta campestris]|uniref:Auxin-responsive protein n=2 Tax=Cuscuta sect. Cleistogrammica TaxID=1824901 RepID=A0A484KSX4_9ASTE|nr:hypothetical protein DM860_010102 [Cuscuta australis]VFQ66269.1 unnamed protein product [Cuscuta campestris]
MGSIGLGLEITELRLGLPGTGDKKRPFSEADNDRNSSNNNGGEGRRGNDGNGSNKARNTSRVVGWPPVCSYRRKQNDAVVDSQKAYVKVSMDGAPFLRKVDLAAHDGYSALVAALHRLFHLPGIGEELKDGESSGEYAPIYEDKDGDWMLLGDVPWGMFIESCKRLRIMKKSEAKGFGLDAKNSFNEVSKEG